MKYLLLFLSSVLLLALPASAQRLEGNHLDLAGGYLQVPHSAELNSYPLTITAWIRTTSSSPQASGIVSKYVGSSLNGYSLHLAGGRVYAWYFNSGGNRVFDSNGSTFGQDGGAVNDGAWHHIAYTVDSSGGKIYVDGVLKSSLGWSGTPSAPTTTLPLYIGRYHDGANFRGQLDDVAFRNVALNQAAIQASMGQNIVGNQPGVVSSWNCDESSGLTVNNSRGAVHTATINGAVNRVGPFSGNALIGPSYVAVANTTQIPNPFPLTLSAWVKTTGNSPTSGNIIRQTGVITDYGMNVVDGRLRTYYMFDSSNFVASKTSPQDGGLINDGAWHFVAYAVDASGGKLYVDGILKNSASWTGAPAAATTMASISVGRDIIGQTDDVALWNFAQDESTVQDALTRRLSGNEPGLTLYLPFDEASSLSDLESAGCSDPPLLNTSM